MSPLWLVGNLLADLNVKAIILVDIVWAGFAVIEVGEWSVIV